MGREDIADGRWHQIGGDMNIAYGASFARRDGACWSIIRIDPVREYVGDNEAAEVGFPFWTKEGYFDKRDIMRAIDDDGFVSSMGLADFISECGGKPNKRDRAYVASAMLDYGYGDPGPAGWGKDIIRMFGSFEVVMWCGGSLKEDLEEEDESFRREVLEEGEE